MNLSFKKCHSWKALSTEYNNVFKLFYYMEYGNMSLGKKWSDGVIGQSFLKLFGLN